MQVATTKCDFARPVLVRRQVPQCNRAVAAHSNVPSRVAEVRGLYGLDVSLERTPYFFGPGPWRWPAGLRGRAGVGPYHRRLGDDDIAQPDFHVHAESDSEGRSVLRRRNHDPARV